MACLSLVVPVFLIYFFPPVEVLSQGPTQFPRVRILKINEKTKRSLSYSKSGSLQNQKSETAIEPEASHIPDSFDLLEMEVTPDGDLEFMNKLRKRYVGESGIPTSPHEKWLRKRIYNL